MSEGEIKEKGDVNTSKYHEYQEYRYEREEWDCYKKTQKSKDARVVISEPFLIMELNRLVPYLENSSVKFHPLNMPHIKIGKVEVVGFVMNVKEDVKFYEIQVDDGTGLLTIFYEKNLYQSDLQMRENITKKFKAYAERVDDTICGNTEINPICFPKSRPGFNYPPNASLKNMAVLEHLWWLETEKGLLGKKIVRFDYIHAVGYCLLDFVFEKKPQEEITFKHLSVAKLNLRATKLKCIDEKEYNCKLISWITDVVQRRYKEPGNGT